MLHSMRNSVGSLGAKILLGLLVLAFAAWGVEGVFNNRTQSVVATVGEAEIDRTDYARRFDNELNRLRQSTPEITPQAARRIGFDQRILLQMAQETALDEDAKALGLAASDEAVANAIKADPTFQDAYDNFSKSQYDIFLSNARIRNTWYEEQTRKILARNALIQTIGAGTTAPRSLAKALYEYQNEQRAFEHISLSPADVEAPETPTDEQLATFHEGNAARFTAPEYRKVSYVSLAVDDLSKSIEITESDLETAYNNRIADYTKPERRNLEQLVFDTEADAKDAASKIASGASFAQVAEARGESADDVALGTVAKATLPGALADAAFAADEPGIVDPVGTALGWSLINVRSIEPEEVTPFEKVKDSLRDSVALTRARRAVPERSVDLDDQIAGGASLQEAAQQTGARFGEVALVDATGRDPNGDRVADLPSDPDFLVRVFDTELNADPVLIEGSGNDFYALRVEGITPAALRPLDTVKDDVAGAWEVDQREKALAALTADLRSRLADGTTLSEIAEELEKDVETLGPGIRSDRTLGISDDLVAALFDADKGDALEGAAADGLSRIVGTVTEIIPATTEDDEIMVDRMTETYARFLSDDFINTFQLSSQNRHPVQVNQQAIEAVFTDPSGYGGY